MCVRENDPFILVLYIVRLDALIDRFHRPSENSITDIMRIGEDAVECRAVPALAGASVTGTSTVLTLSQLGVWRTQTVKLIKDHRNRPSFDFPLEHKAHILSSLFVNDHVRAFCIPSVPVRKISLLECPLLHLCFQRSGDFTGYVLRVQCIYHILQRNDQALI